MVGRFTGGETGAGPTRGGFRGELIEVFPHGKLDVKAELETLITACDEPRWFGLAGAGLRRYKQIHAGIGEEHKLQLVSRDYWRKSANPPPESLGWYENARGTTRVWVDCWQWTSPDLWEPPYSQTSFFKRWISFNEGGPIEFHDGTTLGWLEISCLTWHYAEMGDYGTSLFIEPVREGHTRYGNKHELLAQRLAQAITEKLHATPPTQQSHELRQQREAAIEEARRKAEEEERAAEMERQRLLMEQREAKRVEEENRRIAFRRRQLAVIYDSSYLMEGRELVHLSRLMFKAATIMNIIPIQVKAEIGHIFEANDARRVSAATGRGRIIDLRAEADRRNKSAQYEEVDLSAIDPFPRGEPLDADSDTDRRLIAYGLRLIDLNKDLTVVIASGDGGIGFTVDRIRRQTGNRLFRMSDAGRPSEIAPIEQSLDAVGS